ncbi:MAG: TauD/TfdA dioxygenase family protein, partial [Woeseiaceae bacterium]
MTYESFEIHPLTRALGGVVSGLDLAQPLEPSVIDELKNAYLEYQVLFFRDQDLSPEQFEAFVKNFGEIDNHHFIEKVEGSKTVEHLYPKQNDNPYVPPTSRYHIDVSMMAVPTKGAALYAVDVDDAGGDTIWVSTYAAYDGLSGPMKEFVEGRSGYFVALHSQALNAMVQTGPDAADAARGYLQKPAEHPLVHTHPETGRKALFVDSLFMWSILGLHPDESDWLKQYLFQHIGKPEFQCRFQWQPGSLAIWDNRCT